MSAALARVEVPTPPGFRFRTTLLSHGWVELAPFTHDEGFTTLHRTHRLDDGRVLTLEFRPRAGDGEGEGGIRVTAAGTDLAAGDHEAIAAATRRTFSLDLDLTPFYERLRGEERYRWVEPAGAGRLLRSPTVWEDLAKTLLTTNTTWAQTRNMVRRLTALGPPAPEGAGGGGDGADGAPPTAFPPPERVAELAPEELGERIGAGYRGPYLHALAHRIAGGELDVETWADPALPTDELYRRVTELQGFGPYAAGNVLKLLGHFDELALDSAARSMFARRFGDGEPAPDSAIGEHYEPYGEWRGLVLWMDLLQEWFESELGGTPDPGDEG